MQDQLFSLSTASPEEINRITLAVQASVFAKLPEDRVAKFRTFMVDFPVELIVFVMSDALGQLFHLEGARGKLALQISLSPEGISTISPLGVDQQNQIGASYLHDSLCSQLNKHLPVKGPYIAYQSVRSLLHIFLSWTKEVPRLIFGAEVAPVGALVGCVTDISPEVTFNLLPRWSSLEERLLQWETPVVAPAPPVLLPPQAKTPWFSVRDGISQRLPFWPEESRKICLAVKHFLRYDRLSQQTYAKAVAIRADHLFVAIAVISSAIHDASYEAERSVLVLKPSGLHLPGLTRHSEIPSPALCLEIFDELRKIGHTDGDVPPFDILRTLISIAMERPQIFFGCQVTSAEALYEQAWGHVTAITISVDKERPRSLEEMFAQWGHTPTAAPVAAEPAVTPATEQHCLVCGVPIRATTPGAKPFELREKDGLAHGSCIDILAEIRAGKMMSQGKMSL